MSRVNLEMLCLRLMQLREGQGWTQEEAGTRLQDRMGPLDQCPLTSNPKKNQDGYKIIYGLEHPLTVMFYYTPAELYHVAELYSEPNDPGPLYQELCTLAGHIRGK